MNTYHCFHYLCRETEITILAVSSFDARKEMAHRLGVHVTDIVGVRVR